MRSATIQIQPRGNVVLPAKLRAKYGLDAGDNLTVINLNGSILLSPRATVVPKLAAEIERLRLAAGLDIADLLTSRQVLRGSRRDTCRRSWLTRTAGPPSLATSSMRPDGMRACDLLVAGNTCLG